MPELTPLLNWVPARRPTGATLSGGRVRLEALSADHHATDLFAAAQGQRAADPALWDYMPYGPFADAADFAAWVRSHESSEDPRFYAVIDAASGRPEGVVSYLRIEPTHGCIEIGHIWFGAALQRTAQATEAIYLLARHAFDDLGYRRLEWKCDAANARSRAAAERFGFRFEGLFRQHLIVKGRNRDTAWYAMLDGEWPTVRAAFEAWLDPANFDDDGRQRRPLAARADASESASGPGLALQLEERRDEPTGFLPWFKRPATLWVAGSIAAVVLAIPGVILYARDPGVATFQLNQLLLIPLIGLMLYGLHRIVPMRVQWVTAVLLAPAGPIAYLIWPNEQWWNYGMLTVLPLMALATAREARTRKEHGEDAQPNAGGLMDGPWGPP